MGWLASAKGNEAGRQAREARDGGKGVLVYKFIEASGNSRLTGPMSGMAEQIEAIEAEGWALADMSAAQGKSLFSERVALVCMFRRT